MSDEMQIEHATEWVQLCLAQPAAVLQAMAEAPNYVAGVAAALAVSVRAMEWERALEERQRGERVGRGLSAAPSVGGRAFSGEVVG